MTTPARTMSIGYGANRNRKPEERTVRWGKYKGSKMVDVPTSYLEWFIQNAYGQMVARKEWVNQELNLRKEAQL